MQRRVHATRPELKRQRQMLARFRRYLPLLELKEQLLQLAVIKTNIEAAKVRQRLSEAEEQLDLSKQLIKEPTAVDVIKLSQPSNILTEQENVAGEEVPIYIGVDFPAVDYSLFATPPWLERLLEDLRSVSEARAAQDVLQQRKNILEAALSKARQRKNLFEKVKIPQAQENLRVIRIRISDQLADSVARAKIAKARTGDSRDAL